MKQFQLVLWPQEILQYYGLCSLSKSVLWLIESLPAHAHELLKVRLHSLELWLICFVTFLSMCSGGSFEVFVLTTLLYLLGIGNVGLALLVVATASFSLRYTCVYLLPLEVRKNRWFVSSFDGMCW